jgi:hypothetical protein
MPPDNAGYMYAAYIIGGVLVVAYAVYLFFRTQRLK